MHELYFVKKNMEQSPVGPTQRDSIVIIVRIPTTRTYLDSKLHSMFTYGHLGKQNSNFKPIARLELNDNTTFEELKPISSRMKMN